MAAGAAEYPYREALPGYAYQFPRDFFEHPDFRTEWWYYTGNAHTAAGRRYGFELVFFRRAQRRGPAANQSAWRVDDLYLAHLALTDVDGARFRFYERLNRAGPGIAGASFALGRVWNANWSVDWRGREQTLRAVAEGIRVNLRLNPSKPVVIHGRDGISRKAGAEGRASHYISFTRLNLTGEINGQSVSGTAWMDHEWFSHQLTAQQAGWDWFSIQLDDGTELMLFELRRKDGTIDPYSAGTWVDGDGKSRHLSIREFSLSPLDYWTSPQTGARYPVRWAIRVPALSIALECSAAVPAQELVAKAAGAAAYWEGAVRYTGSRTGVGYLEMTGYEKPVQFE